MPRGQKKRKAGEGRAAVSKKIISEQVAEPMESGKYMWPCVKIYLTTVKKYCYVCDFNISWFISPRIYSQILVPLRHLHTNAKPKFITAMDRCFNVRHRSSNHVSARKTLTTSLPKFVQRLKTARAKLVNQRWSSVQDFCVGLADPSVHELASSCATL